MGDRLTQDLVIKALKMATERRRPSRGLLLHSDRGSQYASHAYQRLLWRHGIICSMSRKVTLFLSTRKDAFKIIISVVNFRTQVSSE